MWFSKSFNALLKYFFLFFFSGKCFYIKILLLKKYQTISCLNDENNHCWKVFVWIIFNVTFYFIFLISLCCICFENFQCKYWDKLIWSFNLYKSNENLFYTSDLPKWLKALITIILAKSRKSKKKLFSVWKLEIY